LTVAGRYDIQRFPVGLLEMLGMKGTGDTPHQLGADISGGLDLTSLYLAQRRVTLSANTGVAMVANTTYNLTSLTVPSGEIWFVYGATARLTGSTAAATAIRFWLAWSRANAATTPIALADAASVGALDNGTSARIYEFPAVQLPGDMYHIMTGAVTGVPGATGTVTLDVARLTL
jgi:hypothetical protein